MRPSREKKAENCLFESGVLSFHLMWAELLILSLCVCIYIYIYIYIERERERERERAPGAENL